MKYCPYGEYIDFIKEKKEYRRMCQARSKKYTFYSDWEMHIKVLIAPIGAQNKLDDLKHYLIGCERTIHWITPLCIQSFGSFVTIYLDKEVDFGMSRIIVIFLAMLVGTILYQDKLQNENNFYKDMIQIVEKENKI